MSTENQGGSVSYYLVYVECPQHLEPYSAECTDIIDALQMNAQELNMFKEIWRTAAARQGKKKRGSSLIRGAEKIKYFADRNLQLAIFKEGK